jgi:hypothetical protein
MNDDFDINFVREVPDDPPDDMDDFMASLDAKAKKFKQAMIADAFREYSNFAKAERKKLVEFAMEQVAKAIEDSRPALVASVTEAITAQCDKVAALVSQCTEAQDKLEKAVAAIKSTPTAAPVSMEGLDDLTSSVREIRRELNDIESRRISSGDQRQAEHQALMDSVMKAIKSIPTPQRPVSFTMKRDDYNRVTDVVANY